MQQILAFTSRSETDTSALAQRLAARLGPQNLIALVGDLGMGKSLFARAAIRRLMRNPSQEVPSPTFTLVQTYQGPMGGTAHADLYRLEGPEEVADLALDDLLADGPVFVEWPDRLPPAYQATALLVRLSEGRQRGEREITLYGDSNWQTRLRDLTRPARAMILSAGMGKRMGTLGETTPKPLVPVANRSLLDRAHDRVTEANNLSPCVVNVHHLADQIEDHLGDHSRCGTILISDERDALLETGGGVSKALPLLAVDKFAVINADALWLDGPSGSALDQLMDTFDPARMDFLLLLIDREDATGFDEPGTFFPQTDDGQALLALRFRDPETESDAPLLFGGVMVTHKAVYEHDGVPTGSFSNRVLFEQAAHQGRLFGLKHDGDWMHVGTPEGITLAEQRLDAHQDARQGINS